MNLKNLSLIFGAYYLYTLLVGFLIQFFVLPFLFPQAHWGHGLLVGGDWILFHTEAVELARRIAIEGWFVWSLRPEPSYQSMSGITALFYALTGIYEPWIMLFYNAFLHAFSGVLLYAIYREFNISHKLSFLFATIFVLMPTSLTWTTQIHKDGLYIAGMFLTMFAIVNAFKEEIWKNVLSIACGFMGGVLFWIVGRGYALEIISYFYALFIGLTLILAVFNIVEKFSNARGYFKAFAILFIVLLVIYPLKPQTQIQTQPQTQIQTQPQTQIQQWKSIPFIPSFIDKQFKRLAEWRVYWITYLGGTPGAVDQEVRFYSVLDFIKYTPRALFVGLFAPLPEVWFTKGLTAGGTIARYITPFEAMYLYLAWLLLPFTIYFHRKKIYFWFLLLLCLGFVWLHVVAEPNYGPIVRKRYAYVMFLSGLSYITFIYYLKKLRWKEKSA
ncbi:hypothetical protein V4D30_01290 [Thermodesulfovibrio sp. 3907-1M]|uniref:Glycosyltransferase RgtA/B/C/D-like domain-containing protein n=1 Tax=Thermodesulfovibrio autotrophicus TaxID=3118333 RepID=A0AAU8GXI3_9BACT